MKNLSFSKTFLALLALLAATFNLPTPGRAQSADKFNDGYLTVFKVTSGAALGNSGTAIVMEEYLPTGASQSAPNFSVALPSSSSSLGANDIVVSGSATAAGQISRSENGRYILVPGYNALIGAANTTFNTNSVVRTIGGSGTMGAGISGSNFSSGNNNLRGATTDDGLNYWFSGNGIGLITSQNGTTLTTVSTTSTNNRATYIFNGQLYLTTGAGSQGIYSVGTGKPTTTGQTSVRLFAPTNTDTYGFTISPDGLTIYYVGASTGGGTAGIYRSTFNGSVWTSGTQIFSSGGYTGVTADWTGYTFSTSGANGARVYATNPTTLVGANDNGTSTVTTTTLRTLTGNNAFRGLAFSPVKQTVSKGANTPLAGNINTSASDVVLFQFNVGADEGNSTVKKVVLTQSGTATLGTGNDISSFRLLDDADNDGLASVGELASPLATGTVSGSDIAFSGIALASYVTQGSSKNFLVVGNVAASGMGNTFIPAIATDKTVNGVNYTTKITNASGSLLTIGAAAPTGNTLTIANSSAPTIGTTGTLSAVNTTYGANSATTQFDVSGMNMTAGITITPPVGFEISTTSDFSANVGTNASPITVGSSGTIAATTIYVRLPATATVAGSPYSGNIVCLSTGASSVNVPTVASTVSPAGLTISGVSGSNKTYDGTTTATLSGTPAYVGLQNGESFSVTGTPTATFASASVGTGIAVSVVGYTAPTTNYTVTQPMGLTADITTASLTLTANDVIKAQGNTLTGGTGYLAFTGMGLVNAETIGSVTVAYGAGAAAGDPANTYPNSVMISDATGGTFTPSNYSISYEAGDLIVTASPTINTSGMPLSGDTIYGSPSSMLGTFQVSGSFLTNDITVAAPANFEISTTFNAGFASSVILPQSGGSVASTTIFVRLAATAPVTGSPHSGNFVCSSTGATSVNVAAFPSAVAPKNLTVAGLTGDNKEYNRTIAATFSGTASLVGIVGSDDVSLAGTGTATFADPLVGTAKLITVTGYTLAGAAQSNYSLTQPTGLTADITPLALTVSGAAVTTKTYDGNTNATITGTLVGIISPDVVTLVGTGTFDNAGPGTGIAVTSTSTLGGANAGNYSLTQPVGLTGSITGGTNANLSNLTVDAGALSPVFAVAAAGTGTTFLKVVPNATTDITVTPSTADSFATVTVGGNPVVSGSPSAAIGLSEGINTILVVVTAQDTIATKSYTLRVVRQPAATLAAGSIAFTGFNADGNDNLAFAALNSIPQNSVIYFTDEEWNGTNWVSYTECSYIWVASSTISAGSIVTLNDLSQVFDGTASSNLGTLIGVGDANNNAGMGNSDESIYAFQSTGTVAGAVAVDSIVDGNLMPVPATFLALIANEDAAGAAYSLTGTGLSEAAGTAIIFVNDDDGMRYKGARSGLATFADYLPLIADKATNWDTIGGGDGTTYLPFNPTAFTLAAAAPTVSITAPDATAAEQGVNTGAFRFTRTGSTGNALTVSYSVASGAGFATAADYTESLTGSIIIPIGDSFVDLTVTPVSDLVLEGNETVQLTVTDTVDYDLGSPTTVSVTINDAETAVDLSRYVRAGRFSLPHPLFVTAPANNDLSEEASGVTYNWDTDTLFTIGDTGTSVTQVTKTGVFIDTMTLQGFGDPEGITYIGGGQFVFTDERVREVVKFTYVAGGTLLPGAAQIVKLGTTIGNIGLEGLTFDPQTSGFIIVKEADPQGIFQTTVDFDAGTASNGSPSTVNSTNLFAPALASLEDMSDVYAFSNLPAMTGHPNAGNLLILSQESGMIRHVDRSGNILSTMTLVADAGNPLTIQNQTHEGITMDRQGNIYIVSENGGGDIEHPELWVFAPSNATNTAPTAVTLSTPSTTIPDSTSTTNPIKMATIVVTDADGVGVNNFSVSGADAADFQFIGTGLYLKAGTVLNGATKPTYNVTVNVDDTAVGIITPDASANFTLNVTGGGGGGSTIRVTEVAPWSSGDSLLGADWFELTNTGAVAVDITGWRMFDSGAAGFGGAGPLNGVTSIGPGESVIFVDGQTKVAQFITHWFGSNPPAGLQVGYYGGPGLSTGGDAVTIYTGGGTLQARVDFGASPSSPPRGTFDNSAGLNAVTLTQFSVVGANGASFAVASASDIGSPGIATVTSNPLVSIVATDASAFEAGANPGTFRISRTGSTISSMQVIFTLATGAGQAIAADYTPTLASPATIPAGDSFVDITITPVDDLDVEGSETLTLTLGDAGGYDVGSPSAATVTITDNDAPNSPPTAVVLNNTVPSISESTSTASPVRVADISITDDGVGTNVLSLTGADAASFEITSGSLYLKAGTTLSYLTKPTYEVTVNVNDAAVGGDPDASANFTLTIKQFVAPGTIIVSEVSPWSSTVANSPLAADWIEVTNIGTTAVNIAGWKMDDDSNSFATGQVLTGITTIGAGESVIFIETSNLAAAAATFRNLWFGANPPANLQIGNYTGSGVGLGSGGDSVNIFTAGGDRVTGIAVGASPTGPFATFDNAAGAGSTTLPLPLVTTLSVAGVNGAFVAVNHATETGSPGTISNTPIASVYQIANASYSVAETAGSLIVNITRTGATPGADVTFTTTDGTASAGVDFTAPVNPVHFNPGQTSVAVTIPIIDLSSTPQGNRSFTAAIAAVPAGSSIGAPGSATITITEGVGSLSAPATLTLNPVDTAGLPNTIALVISRGTDAGGAVNVTVTATQPTTVPVGMAKLDNVQDYTLAGDTAIVSFANGEATKTLSIPLKSTARFGRFLLTLSSPTSGATLGSPTQTLVEVSKKDTTAPLLTVTFGTPNASGLVNISGAATDSGAVISGLNRVELVMVNVNGTSAPSSLTLTAGAFNEDLQLQHGVNKLTVTAHDNSGKKTSRSASITYTNTSITALAGTTYTGLLVPNTPHVTASNDNSGLFVVTVATSTAVSGKLTVGGVTVPFSGALDNAGALHFKPTSATTLEVIDKKEFDSYLGSLTVNISTGQALAALKAGAGGLTLATSTAAQQATAAAASLVNGTASQKYSVALPSKAQAGLTVDQYPQGDGYLSVTVLPNGTVSVTGLLADGVACSTSGRLHVATATTQAVSLHKNLYRSRGSLAVELVFDLSTATNEDSDVLGAGALWFRPSQSRARFYKDGWTAGVSIDAIGARFTAPSVGSVLPGLGATSPNAQLQFEDGNLPSLATRDFDITVTNGFINKSSDTALKLSITKSTGIFKGVFTHADATRPAYQGIILQEGANAKGFGFFLSTPALSYDGAGVGGGVTLMPKP